MIGIMLAALLPVLIGFLGLALELGRIYNRKAEMQSLADAIAISAARKLNGTEEGIADALAAARNVVEAGYALTRPRYQYWHTMTLSDGAIKFGKSPGGEGGWVEAATAKAAPAAFSYVKVDTAGLNAAYGSVDLLLMPVLTRVASLGVAHVTVAGRQRLKLTPLAICAMSASPASPIKERQNPGGYAELTEYGFRRGVSYNLMKLSPHSSEAVHYLVDPVNLPPKNGNFSTGIAAPYVCSGTMELPAVIGKRINVHSGFPIDELYQHLNSRFELSNGQCNASAAPPDLNIKQFAYAGNSWMPKPKGQVAEESSSITRLHTVADLDPPNDQAPDRYGPLWVFARAVPWSSYVAGKPEPLQGYAAYAPTQNTWKYLYSTGPVLGTYPSGSSGLLTPYFTQVTAPVSKPPGIRFRRVLNIPLLDCSGASPAGTVAAIGRFFMTVPANASSVYAEFAGATLQEELAGQVELFQ